MDNIYYNKYLKYKTKYHNLRDILNKFQETDNIKNYYTKYTNYENNSWNTLQKTNCKYPNKPNNLNKPSTKIKKIALEEAITWPGQKQEVNEHSSLEFVINSGIGSESESESKSNSTSNNKLLDITDKRLKEMDANNIIIQVISPTASGIQNLLLTKTSDQVIKAKEVNDYMYNQISNYTNKFKAFATLPMRDPYQASIELERCISKLGMVGALVNGYDILYLDLEPNPTNKVLFYDTPEYDVLWKKFEELDVPLYLHPIVYKSINDQVPDKQLLDFYDKYPSLSASEWGFSSYLAQHVLRLIISGIFDRFPKLKLILGHMGEMLPWIAERYDHRLCIYKNELKQISKEEFKKNKLPEFIIPQLTLTEYLQRNIYITTSGWFSNDALEYVIKKVGIDRVMFSIDYPFEDQSDASDWMDNVPLSIEDKEKVAYKNAARLLKINI